MAELYLGWALFLFLGCLGPHLLVTGLYLRGWGRASTSRWMLLAEVIYGLVNPVVYLLVFQPALFRRWTPDWLPWVCWLVLAAYWGTRLFGARRVSAAWVERLLQASVVLLVSLWVRDAAAVAFAIATPSTVLATDLGPAPVALLCVPLYALPLFAALRQLAAAGDAPDFFFTRLPRWVPRVAIVVFALAIFATLPRHSEADVRATLLTHREAILSVSRERQLDPRLLAALIEVTQRDLNRPFLSALEESVAALWLFDSKSGLLLAEALDPSLGLAQVKAHTVLTGCALQALSGPAAPKWLGKDYRSVRALSAGVLERIPSPALSHVAPFPGEGLPRKEALVEALLSPEGNLAATGFLLDLLAAQWEGANPAWSIRDRPEILATLFQIGFEHSLPHADPQPNAFGRQVAQAVNEPWIEEHFGGGR